MIHYLALLADVQTPQIPAMPWTEMAAFFAVVAILGGVLIWALSSWLGQRFVPRVDCDAREKASDGSRDGAIKRLLAIESAMKEYDGHLVRIEGHLRAVDALAEKQTVLSQEIALTKQPMQEFRGLVVDLKSIFQDFINDISKWRIEYERRLTIVEQRKGRQNSLSTAR